jgi:hypothetical protein
MIIQTHLQLNPYPIVNPRHLISYPSLIPTINYPSLFVSGSTSPQITATIDSFPFLLFWGIKQASKDQVF